VQQEETLQTIGVFRRFAHGFPHLFGCEKLMVVTVRSFLD